MSRSSKVWSCAGVGCGTILLALILLPMFARTGGGGRKDTCQSNMKELALAFVMYMGENDDTAPSSAIGNIPERTYRSTLGNLPPPENRRRTYKTIFEQLYTTHRGVGIYFCPSDPVTTTGRWIFRKPRQSFPPSTTTSYVLKKAINDAWLDPKIRARKDVDYINWMSRQVMFYERRSFHWTNEDAHKLGVSVNCAFMDGHVKTHRITQFEPDYYNTDGETGAAVKKPQIDPRRYCDYLH